MATGGRTPRARVYPVVAAALVAASIGFCGLAVWMGRTRENQVTHYFFPLGDRGHPGLVAISTAVGFYTVAVIAGMLAVTGAPGRIRYAWCGAAVLFAAVAVDDLLGLHGALPLGDLISRPIYWVSLIVIVRTLAPSLRRLPGRSYFVLGLVLLAISEVVDLYPRGDDKSFRYYGLFSVVEESSLSIGAWCLAAACLGFAVFSIRTTLVNPVEGAAPSPPR